MKRYLAVYNHEKTYLFPNMTQATPEEVAKNYSAINVPDLTCIIETDVSGIMFYTAPEPIQVIASRYDIEPLESIDDTLRAIEDIMNAPQPESEPTAEERIAAAMEYQNILAI